MWTSTEWLGDFLDPVPPTAQCGEALTMGGFPVESFDSRGGVAVFDAEITSNRPDLLCHAGLARELAALTGGTFKLDAANPPELADRAADVVSVSIDAIDLCPHYTARVLRGVRVGPSPDWMRRRLEQVGLRPINNVVDVTNYVLFELGQPLHAFDLAKIGGNKIVVRTAREGERLKTLDGFDRTLTADSLCICDADRPVALAGVMGGLDSEVTDATTDILLESARFDPLSVRRTSRRLKLMSDSSYRFERGLDPTLAKRAAARAAELILQTAGGELLAGDAEAGAEGWEPRTLNLRFAELKRLLGVDLDHDDVLVAFERLGLSPRPVGGGVETTVPSHRLDLNIEVDLVEEAARVVGYDRIPTRDRITVVVRPSDPALEAANVVRHALVAQGYHEAVTFSFVADDLKADFLPTGTKLRRVDANVRKADGHLRPSVLPGLLQSVRHNEAVGNGTAKLFETGAAFWRAEDGPREVRRVALCGGESYSECRGAVESVLERLDATRPVRVEPADVPGFGKGAAGRVFWGDQDVGTIGRVAKAVVDKLDLRHAPTAAELDADALVAGYRPVPENAPLPRFPAARRDVSLVVDEGVTYARLSDIAADLKLDDLVSIDHSGTYRGKPLPKGRKSVTLTFVFRRDDATVPREAAEAQVQRFVGVVKADMGAEVRG